MAGLPVPFLTPSRCVLLITDDALCVYDVSSRGVRLLETVPWKSADFINNVAGMIRSIGKSVLVLNDAVEQHYRKEKVPKIAVFDQANVVKRRLGVAFPNYPIKAALEIKDKSVKKPLITLKAAPKDDKKEGQLYLFAAIPSSDAFAKTLEAINRSGAVISGYCLLPVESSDMVKALSEKLAKQKRNKARATWSVLIGQHHGGGLRQIVIKNGELALTRITPVVLPEESDVANWSADVVQEFQATLTYLSRFGYNPEDGLDVIMIGTPEMGAQIETMINTPCTYYSVTTAQAANLLGLSLGRDVGNHYADPLHAAWIGRKVSPILQLKSREMERVSQPRRVAGIALIVLSLALGGVGFFASTEAQALYFANKNYEVAQVQRKKIEDIYIEELKRKEAMGIDVRLIQGAIAIFGNVEKGRVDPLPLLRAVADELRNLRIDGFDIVNPSMQEVVSDPAAPPPPPADPNAQDEGREFSMILKFSYAGTIKPQDGNAELKDFIDRLAPKLPKYQVSINKKLQEMSYLGEMTEETGLTAESRRSTDRFEAEVKIEKAKPLVEGAPQ